MPEDQKDQEEKENQNTAIPQKGFAELGGPVPEIKEESEKEPVKKKEKKEKKKSVQDKALDQVKKLQALNTPETQGAIKFTIHQATEVLTKPKEFFAAAVNGDAADARFFLFTTLAMSSLLAGVTNMNLFVSLRFFAVYLISTYLTAGISWWLFMQLGSPKKFSENFIVIAYSQAVLFLTAVQIGPLRIVTFIAALGYMVYLQMLGMQKVHELERNTLIIVLAIIAVVLGVIKFVIDAY